MSAWNDNGFKGLPLNSRELRRTSFFPGLGWMLTRNLWAELKPKWPKGFWDDWLRGRFAKKKKISPGAHSNTSTSPKNRINARDEIVSNR